MKKSYLFGMFALAAMTMVGCSNDEVVNDYSQDNAIEFGTYVGRDVESRGTIITTQSLQNSEEGFGVYAYYHQTEITNADLTNFTPNFMNNEQVTYNASKKAWEYNPLKYWPNNEGDKLSFVAYAPWHKESSFPQGGKLKYTVVDDVTQQEDLLWSKSQRFNLTKQSIDDKVEFVFGHALSKVEFTISAGIDLTSVGGELAKETTIYVDEVRIIGLNSTGILDLSKATASWDDLDDKVDYVWDYIYNDDTKTELQNNILTGKKGATIQSLLKPNDYYLFAIPQEFDQDFKIQVTYRVFTKDDKLTVPTDKEGNALVPEKENVKGSLVKNVISVNPTTDTFKSFIAGTQYKLNIVLGMTSVKVNVKVDEWDTIKTDDYWFNENEE